MNFGSIPDVALLLLFLILLVIQQYCIDEFNHDSNLKRGGGHTMNTTVLNKIFLSFSKVINGLGISILAAAMVAPTST